MVIKKKIRITKINHENFVKISEDFNPLHIDRNNAINSGFEDKVVHGIHLLLRILVMLENFQKIKYNSIFIEYINPVYIGRLIDIEFHFVEGKTIIQVHQNNKKCCNLLLKKGGYIILNDLIYKSVRKKLKPNTFSIDDTVNETKFFRINKFILNSYDKLKNKFGKERLYSIVCLSKLVGMHYPGEFGLFKSCKIDFNQNKDDIKFDVEKKDKRFRLAKISVNGLGIDCKIEAFFRKSLSFYIPNISLKNKDFSIQKPFVIGGSQGIGSVFSQILYHGGANVISTYFQNKELIEQIVKKHKNLKNNRIKIMKFDILNDLEKLKKYKHEINSLYIFATPKIFREGKKKFSRKIFNEFKDFYIEPILEICEIFTNSKLGIFLPSSEMINSPISGCEEYILSKELLEKTGQTINRKYSNIKVFTPRFGRVLTRQTNKINPNKTVNIKRTAILHCNEVNNFILND